MYLVNQTEYHMGLFIFIQLWLYNESVLDTSPVRMLALTSDFSLIQKALRTSQLTFSGCFKCNCLCIGKGLTVLQIALCSSFSFYFLCH